MVTSLSTSIPICQPLSVSEGAKNMVTFGVIGYGYWGPNIVRNLDGLEGATVLAISDKSPAARERAQKATHGIKLTSDAGEVILSSEIDAVAIVTPSGHILNLPKLRSRTESTFSLRSPSPATWHRQKN